VLIPQHKFVAILENVLHETKTEEVSLFLWNCTRISSHNFILFLMIKSVWRWEQAMLFWLIYLKKDKLNHPGLLRSYRYGHHIYRTSLLFFLAVRDSENPSTLSGSKYYFQIVKPRYALHVWPWRVQCLLSVFQPWLFTKHNPVFTFSYLAI
jgi:hypothetical protein